MATKDRLKEFLSYKKIGRNKFETKLGIANGYMSSKGVTITSEVIEKASAEFPDLNLEWLITGNGNMLKQPLPASFSPDSGIGIGHIGNYSSPIIQNKAHSQSSSDKKNDPVIFENKALRFEVEQLKKDNSQLKEDMIFFKKQIEELKQQNQELQNKLLEEKDRFINYITQNKF